MPAIFVGLKVAVESAARGAAKSVTTITKGATCTVSVATHGFTAGQYVVFTADSNDFNARVFRVLNPTAGTFDLDGIDSTNFDITGTTTVQLLTIAQPLNTITDVSPSGGDPASISRTTVTDVAEKSVYGLLSASNWTLTSFFEPANAGLILLEKNATSQTPTAMLLTFSDGKKIAVNGLVAYKQGLINNTNSSATNKISIAAQSIPSVWAN
jgi:Phage tail tube protein, TTP